MNQTFLHVRNMELGIFRPVLIYGQHPLLWAHALKAMTQYNNLLTIAIMATILCKLILWYGIILVSSDFFYQLFNFHDSALAFALIWSE